MQLIKLVAALTIAQAFDDLYYLLNGWRITESISTGAGRTARQLAPGVNLGREEGAGLMDCDQLSKEIIKRRLNL